MKHTPHARTRTITVATFLAALTLPALTLLAQETIHAAEHEAVGAIPSVKQGLMTGLTALIVFLLVAVFLQLAVWPKISKGLDDRANKIKEEIESAEMARRQAREALEQYQQNLAQARAEAQRMLEQTRSQQQALAAELKAKADAELSLLRERAMKDIDAAKRAAVTELYTHTTHAAALMAGKILRRTINANDQQQIIEESMRQLQELKA